jgi:trans-AT polyketide synthase/acyltransferase/oxidoreductase domain-containing protein
MSSAALPALGAWSPGDAPPVFAADGLVAAVQRVREPVFVVQDPATGGVGVGFGGTFGAGPYRLLASLPPLYPEWLGDRSFTEVHRTRFPYISGAMANGIATTDLVIAMAKVGMLGFFGAAGLPLERVNEALDRIIGALGQDGCVLGHKPHPFAQRARSGGGRR